MTRGEVVVRKLMFWSALLGSLAAGAVIAVASKVTNK
jgi:hypothetical protein